MSRPEDQAAAAAFVEIIRTGAGGTVADEAADPAEPPGPRAPRPDLSQGSSGRGTYVDAHAEARDRLAEALRQGARSGNPAWTPVE